MLETSRGSHTASSCSAASSTRWGCALRTRHGPGNAAADARRPRAVLRRPAVGARAWAGAGTLCRVRRSRRMPLLHLEDLAAYLRALWTGRTCCRPRPRRADARPRTLGATKETIATATGWTSTMTGSATAATCSATSPTCGPIPTPGSAPSPSRTAFAAHGRWERARSRSPRARSHRSPPSTRRATRRRRQLSGRLVAVPRPVPRPQPMAADLRGRRTRACARPGDRLARPQRALPLAPLGAKRVPRRGAGWSPERLMFDTVSAAARTGRPLRHALLPRVHRLSVPWLTCSASTSGARARSTSAGAW